jgi:hypothetical protein
MQILAVRVLAEENSYLALKQSSHDVFGVLFAAEKDLACRFHLELGC